jgi:uncharacterized MAPEG superfamily protein
MTSIILYGLALALFQIWLIPMLLKLNHLPYLLSNRDQAIEVSPMTERVQRAAINLQESMPAFLTICLLAIISSKDLVVLGTAWLLLRVIYLLCYSFGILYVRSLVWIGSVIVMVLMAVGLA